MPAISTSINVLGTAVNGFVDGPVQLPLALSPFFDEQTKTFSDEAPGLFGMSTIFALCSALRLSGMLHARRTAPIAEAGQTALLAIPRPPRSCCAVGATQISSARAGAVAIIVNTHATPK